MGKCKHENADHLMPGQCLMRFDGTGLESVLVEQLRCLDCGAWLALGRAARADRVEVAAARLAAGWHDANDTDDTLNDRLCVAVLAHMTGFADRPMSSRVQQVYDLHAAITDVTP